MTYDCIIIGAGAAGLFCSAGFQKPVKGLVLEKTDRPGTKLLMSGSGQCNITHGGSIKDFIDCYGKNGGKVRSCLYKYNNRHLMDFLHDGGVDTITREDGKVFPSSLDAADVLHLLLKKTKENGFKICYDSHVSRIQRAEDDLWNVTAGNTSYLCRNVVVASGGCSYPATGSDGGFFSILRRDLNLEIAPLRPALSPINVVNYPYGGLAGISLSKIGMTIFRQSKKVYSSSGDILFTHRNFSGPLVLNLSKYVTKYDTIVLNYLYPMDESMVWERIKAIEYRDEMHFSNLLAKEFNLPKSFTRSITRDLGTKKKIVAKKLTADTFLVESVCGFQQAMCTSGGIDLAELNAKSLELKRHQGVYAIGECLDVDGITGGYNLQFAYSSANAVSSHVLHRIASVDQD